MTNETIKTQAENLKERGKDLLAEGNQRQVVFRNRDGSVLFQTSLTIVAGVALVLLFTGVSIPLVIIAAGVAMFMGIRVEILNQSEI
jgi:hypothetical protein